MREILKQVLPALLTLGTNAIAAVLNPVIKQAVIARYLELIAKVFAVIDPIVIAHLGKVSSSDLYRLVRIAVTTLSDGQLAPKEIEIITSFIFQKFDIRVASDRVLAPQKDPVTLAAEIDSAILQFKEKQTTALNTNPGAATLTGTKPATYGFVQ